MMGTLIERAKAFQMIAEHMSADVRKQTADAFAAELQRTKTPPQVNGQQTLAIAEPVQDLEVAGPVVRYLESLGYREGELVRAAGVLSSAVRREYPGGTYPTLTDELLGLMWNSITMAARA